MLCILYLLCICCMLCCSIKRHSCGWQSGYYRLFYFYNTIIDPISSIFDTRSDGSKKLMDRHNCSTIHGWHNGQRATKRCHRCALLLLTWNFYFPLVPLYLPSSRQRRSEDENNQPIIHSFMFIGKPTSDNFEYNVHYYEWAKQTMRFSKLLHRCAHILLHLII